MQKKEVEEEAKKKITEAEEAKNQAEKAKKEFEDRAEKQKRDSLKKEFETEAKREQAEQAHKDAVDARKEAEAATAKGDPDAVKKTNDAEEKEAKASKIDVELAKKEAEFEVARKAAEDAKSEADVVKKVAEVAKKAAEDLKKTNEVPFIISPISAVKFAWAISAKFSDSESAKEVGKASEIEYEMILKDFKSYIKNNRPEYSEYYSQLVSSMGTTLKNLRTCLNHRDDNFKQDEKIRNQEIEALDKLKVLRINFDTALPKIASSGAIAGVSGLTLTKVMETINIPSEWNSVIFISLFGFGYLVTDFIVVPLVNKRKRKIIDKIVKMKRSHYQSYFDRCRRELSDFHSLLAEPYKKEIDVNYNSNIKIEKILPENDENFVEYYNFKVREK